VDYVVSTVVLATGNYYLSLNIIDPNAADPEEQAAAALEAEEF